MSAPQASCATCKKTVYPNEAIRACNSTFHKQCLKCLDCGITLNLKSVVSHQNKPYCSVHKPTVGHTQVASVTDQSAMKAPRAAQRVQGVSKDARMTFAPGTAGPIRGGGPGPNRGAPVNRGAAAPSSSAPVKSTPAPSASYSAPRGGAAAGGGYRGPVSYFTVIMNYINFHTIFTPLSLSFRKIKNYKKYGKKKEEMIIIV
jgi:hypothetical protein